MKVQIESFQIHIVYLEHSSIRLNVFFYFLPGTNSPKPQYIVGIDECEGSLKKDGSFILKGLVYSTIEGSQYHKVGRPQAGVIQDIYRAQSLFSACRRKGTRNKVKKPFLNKGLLFLIRKKGHECLGSCPFLMNYLLL